MSNKATKGRTRKRGSVPDAFAIPRELTRLSAAWVKHGILGLPLSIGQAWLRGPGLEGPLNESRFLDLFGERALQLFDDLGPIYGKAGQMLLSRLSPPLHDIAETLRLTRLYKDWPPMAFSEVALVLDQEVPHWRTELEVERYPIGVASLAQVHAAVDKDGRQWAMKIVKPLARKRLIETAAAMEKIADYLAPLAVTHVAQRGLREWRELCLGFRHELSLGREAATIERVRAKLKAKRQRILVIPEVNHRFSTDAVLTVERFVGVSLSDVVTGKVPLPEGFRQRLAKSMLSDLLVQVFELGLFHADPHAGNLILMESGAVGLFDWGLAGELLEADRRHIAAILKAVLSLDLERLIDALEVMGDEAGHKVERPEIRKELKAVIVLIKKGRDDPTNKPSMQALFEACLKGAARLGIPVPEGLLLMAKSLITIEGLAKGLDPKVSLGRVATPVLFRAARPGFKDIAAMTKRLPALAKQFFG